MDGENINVFNNGNMKRDFTYVDDIIGGISKVFDHSAKGNINWDGQKPDPASSKAPYRIFNIGRGKTVNLLDFVSEIEKNIGILANKTYLPLQDGDVSETWADVEQLKSELNYEPKVSVAEGVKNFVEWYKEYYSLKEQEAFA